jgi:large subunit ribosomal protein L24
MKMTIKSGDNVLVIAGKDKGKTGKVTAVYAEDNRVLVENVNVVSKHQKPKSQQEKGGIFKKPAPVDASNVMVVCPVCGKATRIAHKDIDGKKVRVCKKCGASLDKEFVKQTKKEAKKTIKAADLKNTQLKAAAKKVEEKPEEKPVEEVKKTTAKKTTTKAATTKATTKTATAKAATKTATTKKAETAEKTTKTTKTTAAKTTAAKKTTTKKSTATKETK